MTTTITLKVNGAEHTVDVEPRTLLVHLIRETLSMTGTH
ncbi:MAG: (2Fe-2S)-binding protein, partial [Bacteroidota bacterium]